jgi:hypothetical protein
MNNNSILNRICIIIDLKNCRRSNIIEYLIKSKYTWSMWGLSIRDFSSEFRSQSYRTNILIIQPFQKQCFLYGRWYLNKPGTNEILFKGQII